MVDQQRGSPGQRRRRLNTLASSFHADRYRSLLDGSQDAVIIADTAGRCLAANRAAETLLGYERDALVGRGLSSLFGRGGQGDVLDWLVSAQRTRKIQARHSDNRLIPVDAWTTRVADASGEFAIVFIRRHRDGAGERAADPVAANGANARTTVAMTLDGVITGWDPTAERLYGYSEDEAVGRSFFVLAPPELAEEIAGLVEQARRGEGVTAYRTVQVTRTGCRIDVCLEIAPVVDGDGNVVAASAIVHDVIGCMRAERELQEAQARARDAYRALRESEERFRGAFAGASIGMALVSPEGRFLQVNPALCAIVGYGEDELLATTFQQITHPDDVAADRELARQLLTGEIDTYQIEKRYRRKDGQEICGRLTVSLVRDPGHVPLYFVAQIQDITPYKAAGRALREAEARYRTLVEQIPAAVYVDAGGSLGTPHYISSQIEALLGYTPEEWVADPDLWKRTLHPDDRARTLAVFAEPGDTEKPIHLEYRFLARDGREVWVHDQVTLVRDETGTGQYWQGFMVDVTDRKRAEEGLRAAKEAAEEANRLKSAFLSMATHELRTPLTIISGYVELLAESAAGHLTSDEREFLDITQTSTRTLAALVDDLLDLARIEAGRLELAIRPVAVAEAIERVQRMVAAQAAVKGIALRVAVAPDLPPVAADLDRLAQVLLNLVGNALKFTEQGSVGITARAVGQGVEIDVTDTGIGIPPEALPRIFDEFRQADSGTTRKFGGSGLGLAIAKRLVEMQGGTISVESSVGVGSAFVVWLPAAAPALIRADTVTRATFDPATV